MSETMPNFVRPRRVLVADDGNNCKYLVDWFAQRNFVAVGREDGIAALQVFREGYFDLVLTAVELPQLSGMQLLQTIKEINPRVPVIMISGTGSVQTVVEALKLGAENFLIKPLSDDDLVMVVDQALAISFNRLGPGVFEGQSRQVTTLKCPSRSELIAEVVFMAAQSAVNMGYVENDLDNNIKLALVEAITNAMEHGHAWDESKIVTVTLDISRECFWVKIEDQGPGFECLSCADPTDPENLFLERGRGIFLMRTIMDEVSYGDDGRSVVMIKNRQSE